MVANPSSGVDEAVQDPALNSGEPAAKAAATGGLVALGLLPLYLRTLLPDLGFWDTAEFQAIGPLLGIAHPTGYPAYTLVAWLASMVLQPFGNEALRANLLSALLVAGGVGVVASTVTMLTGRMLAGIAAGVALGVTAQTWAVALRADPHALHVLLVAVLLLLLAAWGERSLSGRPADRWLIGAAVVFGISLANHGLTLLLAPGIAVYLLAVDRSLLHRPRLVAACALAMFGTAAALYAYLPIRSAMNPPLDYANPQTLDGFLYLVLAVQFQGSFRAPPGVFDGLMLVGGETLIQLGLISLLAILGAVTTARRRPALLLLLITWFAVGWLFALSYDNADIGRYYIVPMITVALLGGVGVGDLMAAGGRVISRRGAPRMIGSLFKTVLAVALIGATLVAVPARFNDVDQSDDRAARRWLDAMTAALPADAVVVSWWSFSTPLWYGRYVEGLRPDLTIIDDATIVDQSLGDATTVIDSYLGRRPVFIIRVPADIAGFESLYRLTPLTEIPDGPVYRIDGRVGLASDPPRL